MSARTFGPADFVHTVTVRDASGPTRAEDWPVHVPTGRRLIAVEFDGVGVGGIVSLQVTVAPGEASLLELEVLPDFVAPGFYDSEGRLVDCAIDGHPVLVPKPVYGDTRVCDWSMTDLDGIPGDTVLCTMYAASVVLV